MTSERDLCHCCCRCALASSNRLTRSPLLSVPFSPQPSLVAAVTVTPLDWRGCRWRHSEQGGLAGHSALCVAWQLTDWACALCCAELWLSFDDVDVTSRCRCHIKMSPAWKIRPARASRNWFVSSLLKYRRPHKKSPYCRIAPRKVSPARQFRPAGKNPSHPDSRRERRIFAGKLSASGDFSGGGGDPMIGHRCRSANDAFCDCYATSHVCVRVCTPLDTIYL